MYCHFQQIYIHGIFYTFHRYFQKNFSPLLPTISYTLPNSMSVNEFIRVLSYLRGNIEVFVSFFELVNLTYLTFYPNNKNAL